MFLDFLAKAAAAAALVLALSAHGSAQAATKTADSQNRKTGPLPKVKQINVEGLKPLLKPNGKPLLINFWATWCDPCREEFPDLVNLSHEFRGKVDFITVSLDDLADIDGDVPKFLRDMDSKIPAFLLHTPDESAAISMVSKDWTGNLPMTVLFEAGGAIAYQRNGKIRAETLRENIRKLLPDEKATTK
jgi:thiol-disulfide isomerase/thioredoxin